MIVIVSRQSIKRVAIEGFSGTVTPRVGLSGRHARLIRHRRPDPEAERSGNIATLYISALPSLISGLDLLSLTMKQCIVGVMLEGRLCPYPETVRFVRMIRCI